MDCPVGPGQIGKRPEIATMHTGCLGATRRAPRVIRRRHDVHGDGVGRVVDLDVVKVECGGVREQ